MPSSLDDPFDIPVKEDKKSTPAGEESKHMRAADHNLIRDWIELLVTTVLAHGERLDDIEAALGLSSGSVFIGDGSDGDVVLDGVSTVLGMVPVSGVYMQERHIFAETLTFSATNVRLHTDGWIPYVRETLTAFADGTSRISCNGGDAAGGAGGVAATSGLGAGPLQNGSTSAGGSGSVSQASAPIAAGTSPQAPYGFIAGAAAGGAAAGGGANGGPGANGGIGQGGGGGGCGSNGVNLGAGGGPGGTVTLLATDLGDIREGDNAIVGKPPRGDLGWTGGTGGGGGRGGFDSHLSGNSGYGGGGGGGGGYCVVVAKEIINALTVEANGGDGGDAQAGFAGGGGGGGAGGIVVVGIGQGDFPTMLANGGDGGDGATGLHTGGAGGDGGAGLTIALRL